MTPEEWWKTGAALPGLVENIQICIEGDGVIDQAALAEAVDVASRACPGARLVRRGQRWVDSGRAPEIRVAPAEDFDRTRLDSPLLRRTLTCRTASCEVILAQGEPGAPERPATMVFRAHAAVMDGRGAMLWVRQVFRALRGEPAEEATFMLGADEAMAEIAARLGVELPERPASPPAPPPGPEWRSILGEFPLGPRRSLWRRRTIDGIHLGVTAKIARLVTAFGDGSSQDALVQIPVDLREFLPGLRTTAATTGAVNLPVQPDDGWADVDARLLTALSEHQFLNRGGDPKALLVPAGYIREMFRWGDNRARQDPDVIRREKYVPYIATVSHLGEVELAAFCADGFEATSCYSLGTVVWAPEVNITECEGRTEVTVAWRDGPGVAGRVEALLDAITEELSPRAWRCWDGNRTARPAPAATLTSLFAAQADATPDAPAIAGPDGDVVSYARLRARAAGITAALAARGIGPGHTVGVLAGRSAAAIAGIWGVLGAGAAYLPIDQTYPPARITALLTDAAAPACLVQDPAPPGTLPPGCACLPLDATTEAAPSVAAAWPGPAGPREDDLACLIYTSGSTGTPKGVQIEHRALVNYACWAVREAGLGPADKMPLIASMSFDMAGCALYLPLLTGGTILPVPEVNAATLRHVIDDRGATAIALTPSHLELLTRAGITCPQLRVIMTAGELLLRTTALRARQIFGPGCRILCQWGPTETTIVNTSHTFDPATDTASGVPFGRPMDNNAVYLLDARGGHVPPGEPGEACVAGPQLARGYHNHPALTRDRFTRLADGTRIYRTGDIARLLPTGDLAFISRADDQVKIAGHRIEPAEITHTLRQHPEITQAAVVPRSRPGRHDKELCAYIVTSTGTTPADLRDHLTAVLPAYMIPARVITVPDIPRTPNGKTDAAQLPDPFTSIAEQPAASPAPAGGHDAVTAAITGIWARILHADPGQLDDQADFHQLGGNSLLMITMIDEVALTLPPDAQPLFMAELAQIICQPTLGHVSHHARQACDTYLGQPEMQAAAGR